MTAARNLDLRLLDALVLLVAECSVTRAAERMGISQPRMSNILARLRRLFADPLLVRSKQGMAPTARAIQIAASIRAGLSHIDFALEAQRPFDPAAGEEVRFVLAMSDYVSSLIIPRLMRRLEEAGPNLRLSIKMTDPARVRDWLDTGECDMAFGFFMHLGESLRASVLLNDEAAILVRSDHPCVGSQMSTAVFASASHAVMGGEPAPASTLEQMVDSACTELGFERRVAIKAASLVLIADIVANTALVATVPRSLGSLFERKGGVRLLPLPFDVPKMNITMVWHERTHLHPAHIWLRQQIRLAAKEVGADG